MRLAERNTDRMFLCIFKTNMRKGNQRIQKGSNLVEQKHHITGAGWVGSGQRLRAAGASTKNK